VQRIRGQQSFEGLLVDWSVQQPLPDRRLPVRLLSKAQKAAELQRVQAVRAMDAAYEAELVMGLADDTPDTLDPPADHPGARNGSWAPDTELPGVSEFFTAELAVVLNCGRGTASHLARRAWLYRECLPATRAALAQGSVDEPRAKALADVLAHAEPAIAQAVEARVLPEAPRLSIGRLKARALALLLERDAEAVDARREQAQRQADVRAYPSHLIGMSTLAADLPTPVSVECLDVVDQLAGMLKADGDVRPIGELRASVLADLIRRPWDTRLPAVTAQLHVTASLSSLGGRSTEPAEVAGQPITASHVRELVRQLGFLGLQAPENGSLTFALTDDDGRLLTTASGPSLERTARRGCREHQDGDCTCPVLSRPAASTAYSPTATQIEWVRTRDRHCRFPNCGRSAAWADLDHVTAHARGGATDCANLCCLCRSHHRLKTFARDWRLVMDADGVLRVTTPSGITRTTRPPGLRPPDLLDRPPDTAEPPAAPVDDDDPPPF
jgi:hypothetical protein